MDPFTWMALLSLAGTAAGGIGGLFGASEEKNRKDKTQKYLEENYPEWQDPNYQFDKSKYSDILNPMAEQNATAMGQLQNFRALQGQGQSGVSAELVARQANRGTQNMQNKMTELARQGESEAWDRALRKYQIDADRARTIASAM